MNYRNLRLLAAAVILVLLVVVTPGLAHACPNCKDALSQNDPARSGLSQGFFWSILLMLGTPFLVTIGLGTYFYLLVRKARLLAEAKAQQPQVADTRPESNLRRLTRV